MAIRIEDVAFVGMCNLAVLQPNMSAGWEPVTSRYPHRHEAVDVLSKIPNPARCLILWTRCRLWRWRCRRHLWLTSDGLHRQRLDPAPARINTCSHVHRCVKAALMFSDARSLDLVECDVATSTRTLWTGTETSSTAAAHQAECCKCHILDRPTISTLEHASSCAATAWGIVLWWPAVRVVILTFGDTKGKPLWCTVDGKPCR